MVNQLYSNNFFSIICFSGYHLICPLNSTLLIKKNLLVKGHREFEGLWFPHGWDSHAAFVQQTSQLTEAASSVTLPFPFSSPLPAPAVFGSRALYVFSSLRARAKSAYLSTDGFTLRQLSYWTVMSCPYTLKAANTNFRGSVSMLKTAE